VRGSGYGFQCATALSVSVGPELSSAVKRGSPNSKRPSPATQPNSLADLTPAVGCHFGSALYADRLCIGKRRHFPATSLWPWGHLLIPPSRHPRTLAGKRNGIAGLSRFALWLSTIQIETLPLIDLLAINTEVTDPPLPSRGRRCDSGFGLSRRSRDWSRRAAIEG
jgi:hypothetical protein